MKVAVVGTAGRGKEVQHLLTRCLFESMVKEVAARLVRPLETVLISGGAAWADHVAVTLFLRGKVAGLELHLPCAWDAAKNQFVDTGSSHWAANPGRTANAYHRKFTTVLGRSSMNEIATARARGAVFATHDGFHARNTVLARECDRTISLTWAEGDAPTSGGSLDQWRKCLKAKEHVSLHTLVKPSLVVKRKHSQPPAGDDSAGKKAKIPSATSLATQRTLDAFVLKKRPKSRQAHSHIETPRTGISSYQESKLRMVSTVFCVVQQCHEAARSQLRAPERKPHDVAEGSTYLLADGGGAPLHRAATREHVVH